MMKREWELTDELAIDPDTWDGRLAGPLQQQSLDLRSQVSHGVQLKSLESDLLVLEILLDLGAEWAVRLGKDGDRVLRDSGVDQLSRSPLLPDGGHPGADLRA